MLEFDYKTIYNYFNRWYLKLNTTKTATNFFHLNNHEADNTLNIKINDSKLPSNKTPKYLGVYLDRTLTYRKHLEESTNKLKKRNSLIKKLTETTWGASPSVLKICALALCYSVAEYCAPVWGHSSHTKNRHPTTPGNENHNWHSKILSTFLATNAQLHCTTTP